MMCVLFIATSYLAKFPLSFLIKQNVQAVGN